MDNRVFETGAVGGAPTAPAVPSVGYPTDGNPLLGIDATWPGSYWFHQLSEELRAVIVAAGITPNHTVLNQLLLALQGGFGLAKSIGVSGYIELRKGVFFQWGSGSAGASDGTASANTSIQIAYPIAFPTATAKVVPVHFGGNENVTVIVTSATPSYFTAEVNFSAASTVHYLAIGY